MTGKSKSTWPVVITDGTLVLRPLRFRDRGVWLASRRFNREWLQPWEATAPIKKVILHCRHILKWSCTIIVKVGRNGRCH